MIKTATSILESSGNMIADRRYAFAKELAERGNHEEAADLFAQAVEVAPRFVAAWFALGEAREKLGDRDAAITAFRAARDLDPTDRHGAVLRLVRLGAERLQNMPPAYVRTLFDQNAGRFDLLLTQGLAYRGPEILKAAVVAACSAAGRRLHFGGVLDLGCGTGLCGAAFRPFTDWLVGVDLSPEMIKQARAKGLYDRLIADEIMAFLHSEASHAHYHLVMAADVLVYFSDLDPVLAASARVLDPGGLLAFTVETHQGDDVVLGEKLRSAHGAAHVRAALAMAGLQLLALDDVSTRNEAGVPVPGLVALARRA